MSKYGLSAETLKKVIDATWNEAIEAAVQAVRDAMGTESSIRAMERLKKEMKE